MNRMDQINRKIRIATRQSPLALWQAHFVRQKLEQFYPELLIELVPMVTEGDILLDSPLAKIGGKGLFVKKLERAMLNNEADLAVHSMKDVPVLFEDGLKLSTICQREDRRDAFISNQFKSLADLPKGAKVGTSSLRRQAQLLLNYPHLKVESVRGNVGSRLAKLDSGQYDALILAVAGLIRLNLSDRITTILSVDEMIPAVGQGAIGIEIRANDDWLKQKLTVLDDAKTRLEVLAERAMNASLQGGCQVPIACFTQIDGDNMMLTGLVASLDGKTQLKITQTALIAESAEKAIQLGKKVGQMLLDKGAKAILEAILKP